MTSRSLSDCSRRQTPLVAPDPMEIDYICSFRSNANVPRAYFYLGAVENQRRNKLPLLTGSTSTSGPVTSSIEQLQSQEQTVRIE